MQMYEQMISIILIQLTSANVNTPDVLGRRSTALHFAAGFGRIELVVELIKCGAHVDARDDCGLAPIHNAASFGHADVVRTLTRLGADPNVVDNWGFSPLIEAAQKSKVHTVSNSEYYIYIYLGGCLCGTVAKWC